MPPQGKERATRGRSPCINARTTCAGAHREAHSLGVRMRDPRIPLSNTSCVHRCRSRRLQPNSASPPFQRDADGDPLTEGPPLPGPRWRRTPRPRVRPHRPVQRPSLRYQPALDPTPPVRLTLNEGADRSPSWLPDGSGIVYSTQQLGRPDADVCLAELPPGGGTQVRLVCDLSRLGADTNNAIQHPRPRPTAGWPS